MVKIFKNIFIVITCFITIVLIYGFINYSKPFEKLKINNSLYDEIQILIIDNQEFRDLNKNSILDVYEDHRLDAQTRSNDLLSEMTLEEKVGQMFHPPFILEPDLLMFLYEVAIRGNKLTESHIVEDNITHFNLYGNPSPVKLGSKINYLQKIASRTRLGIPITISSDPIHEVPRGGGIASFSVDGFSKWPSQLGFAASQDPNLVRRFAEVAREEYLAVGIRTALHPMSDLATDPRWARNFGTFGSSAYLSSDMTLAYMDGFQGKDINNDSVLTMVKHFPGGGPQEDGLDAHLFSGRNQIYPGNNFNYHLIPFKEAIKNNLKVIMPYYGIPVGQTNEEVAMAFNKYVLTDLLRNELGYDGVICSDWGVITGRHWGVDSLSIKERYKKSLEAGLEAQRRSIVLLENNGVLPLKQDTKIFVDGLDKNIAAQFGTLVEKTKDADIVIMYIHTVFNGNQESGLNRAFDNFLSTLFPNGDLNFNEEILDKVKKYSKDKDLIVVVDLNRPAILASIKESVSGLIGTFGVEDSVIFEGLYGQFNPSGRLPFEIPSSMKSVLNQKEDMPDDTSNPTYKYGYGASY